MLNFVTFWINHMIILTTTVFTSVFSNIKMYMWGIKHGNRNKFNGFPVFKVKPASSIVIGNKNKFNSTQKSNLIGINRKCVLATHRKNASIIIRDNCGFSGTVIGAFEKIEIGNNVICGGNTLITDSDWHGIQANQRAGKNAKSKPVKIKDNVWLGVNSIVLKGVTIGENSIIGANSVVTKNIPANVIAGGNPCKILKTLE